MSEDTASPSDPLISLSEGAGLFLIGRIFSRGIGLATNIVLTRFLGTNLYGIYAYFNVISSFFMVFTRIGGNNSMMRFIPEYEDQPRKQQAVLTLAYGSSLVASILVALLIYVSAPLISAYTLDNQLFTNVLQIGAVVIPFNTLSMITFAVFKSIERMDYNIVASSIAKPILRFAFVGGAVALGYSLIGAVAGIVISGLLTLAVALVILLRNTELGRVVSPTAGEAKEYYNFSLPLTFNQLGYFIYNKIDILMIGFFLSGSFVGIYQVAVAIASFLSLSLTAFNQLFPPIASRLYHSGEDSELEKVYGTVTRITFTTALFPAIAATVYAPEVLLVFGEGFTDGSTILILLLVAQLANCFVGPSGHLLMMTDHQYVSLFNQVSSGVLNAILNYVFITSFGIVGAALATASVLILVNFLRVGQVWYFEGLFPYNLAYLKPVVAGIASSSVMFVLSTVLHQYVLLIVGGLAGALIFFFILYLLGIREEIALLRDVLG
jgi:O-antigen/teichoic acid export membrane protein